MNYKQTERCDKVTENCPKLRVYHSAISGENTDSSCLKIIRAKFVCEYCNNKNPHLISDAYRWIAIIDLTNSYK